MNTPLLFCLPAKHKSLNHITIMLSLSGNTTLSGSVANVDLLNVKTNIQSNTANINSLATSSVSLGNSTVNAFVNSTIVTVGNTTITPTRVTTTEIVTTNGNVNFDTGGLIYTKSNRSVGIGTQSPAVTLDIRANDAVIIPAGNTFQRPSIANGVMRFNTETSAYEGSIGGQWTQFLTTVSTSSGSNTQKLLS